MSVFAAGRFFHVAKREARADRPDAAIIRAAKRCLAKDPDERRIAMFLAAGARLGPYEVVAPIGAGGMGEVYKARDTRLNRIVAIKVLPDRYRKDPDRQRRLEREAKAIAERWQSTSNLAVAVLLAAALARVTAWEGRDQLRYSAG